MASLAAGGGGVAAVAAFPGTILAANAPMSMPPHLVTGILVRASSASLLIHAAGFQPAQIEVALTPATEVCRRGCRAGPAASLQPGDRIETGTYTSGGGNRVANWVVANPLAGWGTVKSVVGNTVTISPPGGKTAPQRELRIEDFSQVALANGTVDKGSAAGLRVGDYIHFTGTGNDPNPLTNEVHTLVLHQIAR